MVKNVTYLLVSALTVVFVFIAPVASEIHNNEPLARNLTYKSDSLNKEYYCYYCTREYYEDQNYIQRECYEKNKGDERQEVRNKEVFKPWCREADGIGFVKICPIPSVANGNIHCPTSNKVYETCNVNCSEGYTPVTEHLTCLESGKFDGVAQCRRDVCAIPPVANGNIHCPTSNKVDKTCNVICSEGYTPVTEHLTCLESGKFDGVAQCRRDAAAEASSPKNDWKWIVGVSVGVGVIVIGVIVAVCFFVKKRRNKSPVSSGSNSQRTSTSSSSEMERFLIYESQKNDRKVNKKPEQKKTHSITERDEPRVGFAELTSSQRTPAESAERQPLSYHTECPETAPPSYRTRDFPPLSLDSGQIHKEPNNLGPSPLTEDDPDATERKRVVEVHPSRYREYGEGRLRSEPSITGEQQAITVEVDYSNAHSCTQLVEVLKECRQNKDIHDQIMHKIDVPREDNDDKSVEGLAHAITDKSYDEIKWTCSMNNSMRNTPFTKFLVIFIEEGKKLGHFVQYFSQPKSKRKDVLELIYQIHKNCQFCHYYYELSGICSADSSYPTICN
ncbi:uncharacterized protein LOC121374008 isoform X2 [Gigantopelta aegis]|uniref:uncharacterized protein LOC121374008 isoform X2 n=1 Tax=Gigantopelta aegis TaxID=1735272 RepID=UPI001B88D35E|nr:uncharacterized protein LOC121374008 isoform X2 [Gigantopelta aegis]